jgi:hypothetical protein
MIKTEQHQLNVLKTPDQPNTGSLCSHQN